MFAAFELVAVRSRVLHSPNNFARVPCCVQYETVRNYPKKPRWIPQIAKTKMYKVIQQPAPPKWESEELAAIEEAYQVYTRSLWKFEEGIFHDREIQMQKEAKQVSEEVELEKIMKINDAENERIKKIREEALIEEHNQIKEEILEIKRQKEEEELRNLEETEKRMMAQLERVKTAIKKEDLDEAIEKALAYETDYNFAVTKDGRYLIGRENATEVTDEKPQDKPVIKPSETIS